MVRFALVAVVALAACSPGNTVRPDAGSDDATLRTDAVVGDAVDRTDSSPPLPQPSPSCRVPDVHESMLTAAPTNPAAGQSFRITAHDARPLANVAVTLCSSDGAHDLTLAGLDTTANPYTWWWDSPGAPRGVVQLIFRADPSGHVYATQSLTIDDAPPFDAGTDAGNDVTNDTGTTFPLWTDLCHAPAGNILQHGDFEEGMVNLAPAFWDVRNPSQPGACMGSGTPDQHVYISAASASCGGHALTIDSHGQWDCFAVQIVTPYTSIEPGHTYRISATIRSQGNAPMGPICPECVAAWFVLGVQWLTATDTFFGDEKNPRPATAALNDHDWQVVQWTLVAPADAHRMLVWASGHFPGRVDYDNVAVVRLD